MATDRYHDLLKQGFMKPLRRRAPKAPRPIVACHDCENWHREGQHTAPVEVRRANRRARALKARTALGRLIVEAAKK